MDRAEADEEIVHLLHRQFRSLSYKPMPTYLDAPSQSLGGLTPKQMQALCRDGWWGNPEKH